MHAPGPGCVPPAPGFALTAAVARLAGAKLVVIPQSPGAVPGTGDYITHMDHVVTALAKALGDP